MKGGGRGREEKEMRLWVGGGSGRRRERYINKIYNNIYIYAYRAIYARVIYAF